MSKEHTKQPSSLPIAADFEFYLQSLSEAHLELLTMQDLKVLLLSAIEAKPVDRVDDVVLS